MTLFRYSLPGLTPLELWDGRVDGVPLFGAHGIELHERLIRFLRDVHAGMALTGNEQDTRDLRVARGFGSAVLTGGGSMDPCLRDVLNSSGPLPFQVEIASDGFFSGRSGVRNVWRRLVWPQGMAIDLGQTQMKLFAPGFEAVIPRDPDFLPVGRDSLPRDEGRKRIRHFLQEGLHQLSIHGKKPEDGIVLGLPVKISDTLHADTCSYPGLSGDLEEIFSGLFNSPVAVMNDAELTGAGWEDLPGRPILIVTLGFAIGGALWQQDF